jgi:hypothetical protein
MAAITNLSDLINRITGGSSGTPDNLFFYRDARVDAAAASATVAGRWTSLWMYEGTPAGGPAPTTVAIPTNASDGALKQSDPGGGRQKWLLGGTLSSLATGTLIVYDRLLHIGNLNATTITAQTVGGTLTRYTSTTESVGNQIWVEIYTIIGTTATTITASYTNQAGTSGRTTTATAFGGTGLREAQRIIPLPLAQGDTGVQAVASVTVLASTTTAGAFGVTIAKPLLVVPCSLVGVGSVRDLISGLPSISEVKTGACLSLVWVPNGTTAPQLIGSIHMVEA